MTNVKKRFCIFLKKRRIPPPVGLEPTTFELEVQHACPLRHGGLMSRKQNISVFIFINFKHDFVFPSIVMF